MYNLYYKVASKCAMVKARRAIFLWIAVLSVLTTRYIDLDFLVKHIGTILTAMEIFQTLMGMGIFLLNST